MAINTKTVVGRRELTFHTLDDILREVDSLERKDLTVLGNWSVGQILMHLATVMNGAIDGMPFKAPWYIAVIARMLKQTFITRKMSAGFKLPKNAAALIPGECSDAEGFAAIRRAIGRLKTETHREPSPVLGPMTIDEYNQLQCRHCELHLGFIVPKA